MDETYIKIKGGWHYLYRAVNKVDNTVDFILLAKREMQAANVFFNKSINAKSIPEKVTIDKSGTNKSGLEQLNIEYLFLYLLGVAFLLCDLLGFYRIMMESENLPLMINRD